MCWSGFVVAWVLWPLLGNPRNSGNSLLKWSCTKNQDPIFVRYDGRKWCLHPLFRPTARLEKRFQTMKHFHTSVIRSLPWAPIAGHKDPTARAKDKEQRPSHSDSNSVVSHKSRAGHKDRVAAATRSLWPARPLGSPRVLAATGPNFKVLLMELGCNRVRLLARFQGAPCSPASRRTTVPGIWSKSPCGAWGCPRCTNTASCTAREPSSPSSVAKSTWFFFVAEGVSYSKDHKKAWLLVDGKKVRELSLSEAAKKVQVGLLIEKPNLDLLGCLTQAQLSDFWALKVIWNDLGIWRRRVTKVVKLPKKWAKSCVMLAQNQVEFGLKIYFSHVLCHVSIFKKGTHVRSSQNETKRLQGFFATFFRNSVTTC